MHIAKLFHEPQARTLAGAGGKNIKWQISNHPLINYHENNIINVD